MSLTEHAFGRFTRHEKPPCVVEQQHAFLQPLQQLLDIGAQFAGVLLGAPVLFVQETQLGVHIGELASFPRIRNDREPILTRANQIDALAHALQRIHDQIRQHRAQEDRDAKRQSEGQHQALQSGLHFMLQKHRSDHDADVEQRLLTALDPDRPRDQIVLAAGHQFPQVRGPQAVLDIV